MNSYVDYGKRILFHYNQSSDLEDFLPIIYKYEELSLFYKNTEPYNQDNM
jgi:hypothetical protein